MGLLARMMSQFCGQPSHQPGQLRSAHSASRHKNYTDAADAAAAIAASAVRSRSHTEPALQHVPGIGAKRGSSSLDRNSRRGSIDVSAAVAAAERVAFMTTSHTKQLPATPEAGPGGDNGLPSPRQRSLSLSSGHRRSMDAGTHCSPSHGSQGRTLDMQSHSPTAPRFGAHRRSMEGRPPSCEHRQRHSRPGSPRTHSTRPSLDMAAIAAAAPTGGDSQCSNSTSSSPCSRLAARQAALAASWGQAEVLEAGAAGDRGGSAGSSTSGGCSARSSA